MEEKVDEDRINKVLILVTKPNKLDEDNNLLKNNSPTLRTEK